MSTWLLNIYRTGIVEELIEGVMERGAAIWIRGMQCSWELNQLPMENVTVLVTGKICQTF